MILRRLGALAVVGVLAWMVPLEAEAFCGFYVSGADAKLYNNATLVVMMREGTRTILSMQNSYEGPPEDFAMVIPVPVVLQKENVKTLSKDIFSKIDQMGAPRLVEYWEKDPCAPEPEYKMGGMGFGRGGVGLGGGGRGVLKGAVKIEAQFEVGEYEVVVLSASDSGALDTWLKDNKYKIPEGAEPVLRPYVQAGTKFFVAKVNSKKVQFDSKGKAVLSPLRFHYDTEEFSLPVRLGLLNANGPQDLLVHILAQGQRYEVANYKNVTIPSNIGVGEDAKDRFGEFYAALFDRTLEKNPGAVVTEYAWDANTCDPCPGPTLTQEDFLSFGADVTPSKNPWGFVLTRLHARYTKETLTADLVFKAAPPIVGGREFYKKEKELEQGSTPDSINNFQGRYIIRHPWKGEAKCKNPVWGRWGGPPDEGFGAAPKAKAAQGLAEAPRGSLKLVSVVRQDIPEIDVKWRKEGDAQGVDEPKEEPKTPPIDTTEVTPKGGSDAGIAAAPDAGAAVLDAGAVAVPDAGVVAVSDGGSNKAAPEAPKEEGGCGVVGVQPGIVGLLGLLAVLLAIRRRV